MNSIKKHIRNIIVISIVGILIIPIIIAQLFKKDIRHLEGVSLEETTFHEINFNNVKQNLNLAGMLFVPEGKGPFPAAVVIHGSGTSQRDSFWYLTLAKYLKENGIIVLLPDKRGSVQSEGNWRTASFQDLAQDTESAVAFLIEQNDINISYIGVIGMSQGGHIAPIVAKESIDTKFVVNIVGSAVPMHDQLIYEENYNLRQNGILPGVSNILARVTSYFVRGNNRQFWNAIGNHDPIHDWEEVDVNSLILYGENDTNVPSERSATRLRSLDKPNIEVIIYQGSGHALEDPKGKGNNVFREDALRDIRDFIFSIASIQ
jgi:dienelactone hydrolase